MTIQAINSKVLKLEAVEKKDPWAILSVLALIRDVLAKGQQKIASSTEKLIENGGKIQDKQLRDLKELSKINLEALKKDMRSDLLGNIALGLVVVVLVGGPIIGAFASKVAFLARAGAFAAKVLPTIQALPTVIGAVAAGLEIKARATKIEAEDKKREIAEVEEHVNVDAALTETNLEIINFSGKTVADAAKAIMNAQKVTTEIINSTGSALQTSIR